MPASKIHVMEETYEVGTLMESFDLTREEVEQRSVPEYVVERGDNDVLGIFPTGYKILVVEGMGYKYKMRKALAPVGHEG